MLNSRSVCPAWPRGTKSREHEGRGSDRGRQDRNVSHHIAIQIYYIHIRVELSNEFPRRNVLAYLQYAHNEGKTAVSQAAVVQSETLDPCLRQMRGKNSQSIVTHGTVTEGEMSQSCMFCILTSEGVGGIVKGAVGYDAINAIFIYLI